MSHRIIKTGQQWQLHSIAEAISQIDNPLIPSGKDRKEIDYTTTSDAICEKILQKFHVNARKLGSQAIWLPVTGVLTVEDASEAEQNLPYDEWRDTAIMEIETKWRKGELAPSYK